MAGAKLKFYEFFAGGGMVNAGLGSENWACLFANDFDRKKCASYSRNWGGDVLVCEDVAKISAAELPGRPNLVWASFPCQDLSLAGAGAGLKGDRSGTFWPFWQLINSLIDDGRMPDIVVLENVAGTLTSHGGKDFEAISNSFVKSGYRFGAMIVDAALFVPHSRPRLFFVGVRKDITIPNEMTVEGASSQWHPKALHTAYDMLPVAVKNCWVWWNPPPPTLSKLRFADIIEDQPSGVKWQSEEETKKLLSMMSPTNLSKVQHAKNAGKKMVGTIYKRTRFDEYGKKVQRAEVRFDDIAGCLRTPGGGSSRQLILLIDGGIVKSRLISIRETARLMGLSEQYILPEKYNDAYHLTGDGVVVPVVRYLSDQLFEPLLFTKKSLRAAA